VPVRAALAEMVCLELAAAAAAAAAAAQRFLEAAAAAVLLAVVQALREQAARWAEPR